MTIQEATNKEHWDAFLGTQKYRPFLQSWTMGEVYRDTAQKPLRLEVREGTELKAICMALIVPARRGKHLSIPYGPVLSDERALAPLLEHLREIARKQGCSFIRMSPFWPKEQNFTVAGAVNAPMHLLAEHVWYLSLTTPNSWLPTLKTQEARIKTQDARIKMQDARLKTARPQEELLKEMRKTTRNLIGRAERDGVTIRASTDPNTEIEHFLALHDETRKRHGFTPYTNAFFRAQVKHFSERDECTLYLAEYQGSVIAASIHMHAFGETSYHHGASSYAHAKIPASYLLQWHAIQDALARKDHVYNFWGVSPEGVEKHPFAGVRLFKTGFGGEILELTPCLDVPVAGSYKLTRAFETLRKWRRGF